VPRPRLPGATSRVFSARLDRGVWRCFRCGASGNALDLWARVTGPGIYGAVPELFRRLGRDVPWRPATQPQRSTGPGAIPKEATPGVSGSDTS
jgi:hypothetical protein